MINAHCQQSPVVYCNEKKLYQFRIFEFKSEPFCEEKHGGTLLTRSCDNVTQQLRQAERNKRMSDSFPFHYWTRAPNRRHNLCNRTMSLPLDLSECGKDYFCREHSHDDQMLLANKYTYTRDNQLKRRINGFHKDNQGMHGSCGMLKLVEDNKGELSENKESKEKLSGDNSPNSTDSLLLHTRPHSESGNIMDNDALVDEQCAKMNSKLNQLSTRYRKEHLEMKSKEELISIVLELQDALKIVTDD